MTELLSSDNAEVIAFFRENGGAIQKLQNHFFDMLNEFVTDHLAFDEEKSDEENLQLRAEIESIIISDMFMGE